ncbi:thiopurine S-methyltransferase [Arenicella chitinivorans]|uniref:Thiopurine S-methyltransferase n=2 Tax=Arenicella chitinivorans TaxID=1329800 RepID=A0A918S3M7_9GAMM|nr:thiopurine S-methyltransferase [Arenicella chitinivorans]
MEAEYWHQKWAARDIGFHEGVVNSSLANHIDQLGVPAAARIFVPLCGKTRDIAWLLSRGYRVVGVELSPVAVSELFTELFTEIGLAHTVESVGDLRSYSAHNLVVWQGDFFALTNALLGDVDAVYDRAALVALAPPLRDQYTAHLKTLAESAPQLLVTYEYDQSAFAGPPFSISEAEVNRHYACDYQVKLMARETIDGGFRGRVAADIATWLLEPRVQ